MVCEFLSKNPFFKKFYRKTQIMTKRAPGRFLVEVMTKLRLEFSVGDSLMKREKSKGIPANGMK